MATIPAGTYVIDPSHSEVSFTVRHAGIAKVRGTFTEFSGQIEVAEELAASRTSVEIAASSIETGDKTRDNHLRSADFFDAEKRPTWTFVSNEVRGTGDDLVLAGELTINGVTRPVELDVEYNGTAVDPWGNPRVGFSGVTEVSRKDFGFMGGFLAVGILVAFLAGLAAIFFQIPAMSLTVSAAFMLLASGLILFQTSQIIHGGETNYVMATVSLYVSIYNLFVSLLSLLGFANND